LVEGNGLGGGCPEKSIERPNSIVKSPSKLIVCNLRQDPSDFCLWRVGFDGSSGFDYVSVE